MLKLLSTGSGVAFQDLGHVGWGRYGVPIGGAMDRHAMRAANRLLGNQPEATVLEIQLQGAKLEVLEDIWVALAGADRCANLRAWTAGGVKAGTVLEFCRQTSGIYSYLAVPGGFITGRWLGSASVDPRNGMGESLSRGALLQPALPQTPSTLEQVARRVLRLEECRRYSMKEHFLLLPGPQFEVFTEAARNVLASTEWRVSPRSDRTGFRLEGTKLEVPDSISSEPVLPGSFQVPGSGSPIITMVDGPTVGGYPKIAVLKDADRDRLAQCAPGTQLTFEWAEF